MSGRLPDWNRHQCFVISDGKEYFNGISVWPGRKITTDSPTTALRFVTEEAARRSLERMANYDHPFVKNAAVYVMTMDISLKKV